MVTKPVANNPVANNPVANNPSTGVDANVVSKYSRAFIFSKGTCCLPFIESSLTSKKFSILASSLHAPFANEHVQQNQLPSSPINQGKIEAFFTNKEFCPDTMPEDFTHSCVGHWGGRCGYMLTASNGLQTRMTCDCNWDCVLQCRVYNGP